MDDKGINDLIAEAISDGAIDETSILIYAKAREISQDDMKTLKAVLANGKGKRAKVPDGFAPDFNATMKVRVGRHNKIARLEDHKEFEQSIHHWRETMGSVSGGWEGLEVEVHGEVRDVRKDKDHLDVLLEKVILLHNEQRKKVPRIWASISVSEFKDVEKDHIMTGDWIELKGRIVWDGSIHFLRIKNSKKVRLDND